MVAEPTATPLTRPLPFTVATAALLLDQVMTRPVSPAPLASFVVAVSCSVWPTTTLPGLGATVTVATGTGFTFTMAVPLFPSLLAVIITAPTATPWTRPLALTVATAALLVDHVTTRPLSAVPLLSLRVAASCTACPAMTEAGLGETDTDATGTMVTPTVAVPLLPSLVAVIVTAPAATPRTRPPALTVASAALLACIVALSCTVCPMKIAAGLGVTVTDATGTTFTVSAEVPFFPSQVAVIVAEPAAMAVTRPAPFTVATLALFVDQVIMRPTSVVPRELFGVAVSWAVLVTMSDAEVGVTATDATWALSRETGVLPLIASLVAVIVTAPVSMAATRPFPSTVARDGSLLDHVTTRPVSEPPSESLGVALSCTLCSTSTEALGGETLTDDTGIWSTTTSAVSDTPEVSDANTVSRAGVAPARYCAILLPKRELLVPAIEPPLWLWTWNETLETLAVSPALVRPIAVSAAV